MNNRPLTHRDRLQAALEHKESDRVPVAFGGPECSIHRDAHRRLLDFLALPAPAEAPVLDTILQIVEPDERLYELFGVDAVWVTPEELAARWDPSGSAYMDELGRGFNACGGFYNQTVFPLQEGTLEELNRHRFPDMTAAWRLGGMAERARSYAAQGFGLVADGPWGLYEISSSLRGTEALYLDLAANPFYAEALAQRVLEEHLQPFYESMLRAVGEWVQMVVISDDYGSQENLLFSPRIFRKVYKPRLRSLVEQIRALTAAKIYLHSDGAVAELIPDFIEIGIDGLNPVQYTARGMDPVKLKQEYGASLGFFGGGIENALLSAGNPQQVREAVRRQIGCFAPGGGYLFATIHNISQEVPPENILAFFAAGQTYGTYPILPEVN